ncbi:Ras GTPase activating protein ira2 [Saccharomyces pastorianus]|uniref:Ras GTPase activating protein ira2 n=1 Tax=Saccharomyces pastorianus TaxID=27292 RepID=A0A6C1EGB3_SACPS|nr:Ras GTPase activating protein ira2 [Saccharomyces pastorianus]
MSHHTKNNKKEHGTDAQSSHMTRTLIKHVLFDRILPILPVESNLSTYLEVEAYAPFISCRSLLFNVAVFRDLNAIVGYSLELIELLLQGHDIISDENNDDVIESILVTLRLLSDVLEYNWQKLESLNHSDISTQIEHEQEQKPKLPGIFPEFSSTHNNDNKHFFHQMKPYSLIPDLASKLIETCSALKFNTRTLQILQNMIDHVHGNILTTLSSTILPGHKSYLAKNNHPSHCKLIDSTLGHILRFVAASNPSEYFEFIKKSVQIPVTQAQVHSHSHSHSLSSSVYNNIVPHLDLFSFIYLTKHNFRRYLEIVKNLSMPLKRTIYHCLLLHFTAKAIMFWIMARPAEYYELFNLLRDHNDESAKSINLLIHTLFEEIHSTFNVNSMITATQNNHPGSSSSSPSSPSSPPSSSSSDNNQSVIAKSLSRQLSHHQSCIQQQPERKVHSSWTTNSQSSTSLSSSASSSTTTSLSAHAQSVEYDPSFADTPTMSNVTISASSLLSQTPTPTTQLQQRLNAAAAAAAAAAASSSSSSNSTQTAYTEQQQSRAAYDSPKVGHTGKDYDENFLSVTRLNNVLELYTHFDDTEVLPHTSVLKFLTTLTMFDIDLFNELNALSFKYIPDCISHRPRERASSFNSAALHEVGSERTLGIKHITQGLKKLTSLPTSTKKTVKFIKMLLKNLNGTQAVSDVALLDTMRALLSFLTMTSAVFLVDKNLPSVLFAKRLIPIIGTNLSVGQDWSSKMNYNLMGCLKKNSNAFIQLQLIFFSSAIQFDHELLLARLSIDTMANNLNLQKLCLYTEGFRIYFDIPSKRELRKSIAIKISKFFKTLFSIIADILLQEFPYFNEQITDIVASILDGTIINEYGTKKHFKGSSPSLCPTTRSRSASTSQSSMTPVSPLGSEADTYPMNTLSLVGSSTSRNSDNVTPLNSSPKNLSTDPYLSHLVAPRARHALGGPSSILRNKVPTTLTSPPDTEKSSPVQRPQTESISATAMAITNSTPLSSAAFGIRSPLQKIRTRRYSDESLGKFMKSTNNYIQEHLVPKDLDEAALQDARRIMINIFSIFKRPNSYFIIPHNVNSNLQWVSQDFRNIMKPIFVAIVSADLALQKTAQSFMDTLLSNIINYSESDETISIEGYHLLCSYTVTLFAMGLFDLKIKNEKRQILLDITIKFLKVRSHLAEIAETSHHMEYINDAEKLTFPLIVGTVGRALFVSLYSSQQEIEKTLKVAYSQYLSAINFHERNIDDSDKTWVHNIEFVEAMCHDNYTTSGSIAFQRRTRNNILRFATIPNAILLDSMRMIYKKWHCYTHTKDLDKQELNDFRNFAGILASLSGVLFINRKMLEDTYPYLLDTVSELKKNISFFISKQCQWLSYPDLLTRENSRDILSVELHPLSFKLLFSSLRLKMKELACSDLSIPENETSYILLEQIIKMLRTILSREDDNSVMLLFSTEIVDLIDSLTEEIKKMPAYCPKHFKAIIQMTKMFSALKHSEVNLGVKNHFHLKNRWLRQVTDWFQVSISREYDFENLSKPLKEMDLMKRDMDILYIDTAIEASTAISFLTRHTFLEIPPAASDPELSRSRSVIFGYYFNILMKGLEKSNDRDKFPVFLKHKMSVLNDNVILSLTNLSNTNVDASLQFTLPMGYSGNRNIRNAFLEVFINIVTNYRTYTAKSDLGKLEAADKYLRFTIEHPQLSSYAAAVCPASDIDAYAAGLINAFETRNATHIAVSQLIENEIEKSSRPTDILRRNSCATRSLSMLARSKGSEYLIRTLQPLLKKIIDNKVFFEIEKLKPEDADAEKQVQLFIKYMNELLEAISNSVSYFPPPLFYICQNIFKVARVKFPDHALIAAGSFVFLRFFCPALVSPDSENIIDISHPSEKRTFISLAKVIQNIANGSENFSRWPVLSTQNDFLKECSDRIFKFLAELCRADRIIDIQVRTDPTPIPFDYQFLHSFIYLYGLDIRKNVLNEAKRDDGDIDDDEFYKSTFLLIDDVLGQLGQPKMEFSNEIPIYIRDHMDDYPELYEFMNRHAFRNMETPTTSNPNVHESTSSEGVPIITLTMSNFSNKHVDIDTVVYKFLPIYARIWTTKHCLIIDCTEFDEDGLDMRKFISLVMGLLPEVAPKNCLGCYYFNVNEMFMSNYGRCLDKENVFVSSKIPHFFINSNSDEDLMKSLGITGQGLKVLQDIRVSLHDITLYDEKRNRFTPVSLKIGDIYFQVLHETPRQYKIRGMDTLFDVKFNDVYEISRIFEVHVSSVTGVAAEFTVTFQDGKRLIFSSPKYLEIVKMFYYAQIRLENEYEMDNNSSASSSKSSAKDKEQKERNKLLCHLLLVSLIGLFDENKKMKNSSYNLVAATEISFGLNFGSHFHRSPEVYVPEETTTFLSVIGKSLAESNPELTTYMFIYILEALKNNVIPHVYIPHTVCGLSYWVPNLYQYVYLADDEEGPENISHIFRVLIRLSVKETDFKAVYMQYIWLLLLDDGRLTSIIVEEVINHALERDSENRDWKKTISLLTVLPTTEVANNIIQKIMAKIRSFLPSLKQEAMTQSWSELTILVKISIHVFFETSLLVQMYLPEILFIVSLLIDVGPRELRSSLHQLLMNVCHSLAINSALPQDHRDNLDEISDIFAHQKVKFMFGFSEDKGRILQIFSATSFASKFNILDFFINNILLLMEYSSTYEASVWKTRYKKYILESVFTSNSFLSARSIMIVGIIGKSYITESLCKAMIIETMKVVAEPRVTDEQVFLVISHIFTYSKIVEGLDPNLDLMKHLFWFSTVCLESKHPIIFEGALLFVSSCMRRLYMSQFENESETSLSTTLLKERKFASTLLCEIESINGIVWNGDNFTHIIVSIVNRGLCNPFIRNTALDFLKMVFKNSYFEHQIDRTSDHYLCYMFLLYLLLSSTQFEEVLGDVDFEGETISIENENTIPKVLLEWLSSDKEDSNISLYQGAVLFRSSVIDEPSKFRFGLIVRHLLNVKPICAFRFYNVIRNEIRKISAFEQTSDCVPLAFDILNLLVTHSESYSLDKLNDKSIELLTKRGLLITTKIDKFAKNSDMMLLIHLEPHILYERKRILTMILSRMACST